MTLFFSIHYPGLTDRSIPFKNPVIIPEGQSDLVLLRNGDRQAKT